MRITPPGTLSARLKAARLKVGHTQASLAAALSIQQPTVCAWELGSSAPPPKRWDAIAAELQVTTAELFFDCSDPEEEEAS